MEQRTTPPDTVLSQEDQKEEARDVDLERKEEYQAVIEPDPLLAEVGEANEKITNANEAQRVIPSKPC